MAMENVLALLRTTYPDGRDEVVALKQNVVNLGRVVPNEIVLADQQVSRQHARLLVELDRISVVDLNSRNGTYVGTTKLSPNVPCVLAYGDAFRIGPFTLRLEAAPGTWRAAGDAPAAPSESTAGRIQMGVENVVPPPEPPSTLPPGAEGGFGDGPIFGVRSDFSRYLQYLPPLYQELDLLGRFLSAFEGVLAPIEQTVDNFDLYLDPVTTPPEFLDRLAQWLGLTLDENWPLDKRRTLVAEAAELYRCRGTRRGLSRHLEIYSDAVAEISEPADRPHHFRVVLPVAVGRRLDRHTLERIIRANQPAHTTYSLETVTRP